MGTSHACAPTRILQVTSMPRVLAIQYILAIYIKYNIWVLATHAPDTYLASDSNAQGTSHACAPTSSEPVDTNRE